MCTPVTPEMLAGIVCQPPVLAIAKVPIGEVSRESSLISTRPLAPPVAPDATRARVGVRGVADSLGHLLMQQSREIYFDRCEGLRLEGLRQGRPVGSGRNALPEVASRGASARGC